MTKKRIALKILRRVGICILTTVVLLLIGLFGVVRIMEFGPSKTARNLVRCKIKLQKVVNTLNM